MKRRSLLAFSLFVCALAACSPKGACIMGSTHDSCAEDRPKSYCDQGSANEFHPAATCASLGYADKGENGIWTKK
jgi:hypothetical protein